MSSPTSGAPRPMSPSPTRPHRSKSSLTRLKPPAREILLEKSPSPDTHVNNKLVPSPYNPNAHETAPENHHITTDTIPVDTKLKSPEKVDEDENNHDHFAQIIAHITSPSPHPRRSSTKSHERLRHSIGSHTSTMSFKIPTKQGSDDEDNFSDDETKKENSFLAISKNVRNSVLNAAEKEREKAIQTRETKTPVDTEKLLRLDNDDYNLMDDDENGSPDTEIRFAKLPDRVPYTKKSIGKAPSRERSWIDFKPISISSITGSTIVAAPSTNTTSTITTTTANAGNVISAISTTPGPLSANISESLYPSLKTPSVYPDLFKGRDIFESSTPKDPQDSSAKNYEDPMIDHNDEMTLRPKTSTNSLNSVRSQNSMKNNEMLHAPKNNGSSAPSLSHPATHESPSKQHNRIDSKGSMFANSMPRQSSIQTDQTSPISDPFLMGVIKRGKKMFFHNAELNRSSSGSTVSNKYNMRDLENIEPISRTTSRGSPTKSTYKTHHQNSSSPVRTNSLKKPERLGSTTTTTEKLTGTAFSKTTRNEQASHSPSKSENNSPISRILEPAIANFLKNPEVSPTRLAPKERPVTAPSSPSKSKPIYPTIPMLYQDKKTGAKISSNTSNAIQAIVDTQKRQAALKVSENGSSKNSNNNSTQPKSPESRSKSPVARNRPASQMRSQPSVYTSDVGTSSNTATPTSPKKVPGSPTRFNTLSKPENVKSNTSNTYSKTFSSTKTEMVSGSAVSENKQAPSSSSSSSTSISYTSAVSAEQSNTLTKQVLRRPVTYSSSTTQGNTRNSVNSLNPLASLTSSTPNHSNNNNTATIRVSMSSQREKAMEQHLKNQKMLDTTVSSKHSLVSKPLTKTSRSSTVSEGVTDAFSKKYKLATATASMNTSANRNEDKLLQLNKNHSDIEMETNLNTFQTVKGAGGTTQKHSKSTFSSQMAQSVDTNNKRKSEDSDENIDEQRGTSSKIQRTSSFSSLASMGGASQRNHPLSKSKPVLPPPSSSGVSRTSVISGAAGTSRASGVPGTQVPSTSTLSSTNSAHLKTPGSASRSSLMKSTVLHQAVKGMPYSEGTKPSNDKIKFGPLRNGYRNVNNSSSHNQPPASLNPVAKSAVAFSSILAPKIPSHQQQQSQKGQMRPPTSSVNSTSFNPANAAAPSSSNASQQNIFKTPQRVSSVPKATTETVILPEIYSESEDDEDGSVILDWANSPQLRTLLLQQQQVDPDTVFGPIAPLQLEDVFKSTQGARPSKFRPRSSSANWSNQDKLTQAEVEKYAKEMGYQ